MMGDAPAITVKAGTTEEWIIENWTNELHTFHIHQLHFRVLEIDGQPRRSARSCWTSSSVPYATATGYHSKEGPVRPGPRAHQHDLPGRRWPATSRSIAIWSTMRTTA